MKKKKCSGDIVGSYLPTKFGVKSITTWFPSEKMGFTDRDACVIIWLYCGLGQSRGTAFLNTSRPTSPTRGLGQAVELFVYVCFFLEPQAENAFLSRNQTRYKMVIDGL